MTVPAAATLYRSTRQGLLLLAAIVVFGAFLRLPGQLYPATLHYDEGAEVSSVLCRYLPTGAAYHPFLSRLLLSFPENLICLYAKLRGSERPIVETSATFQLEPMPFVQIGRGIAFAFGLAGIVAMFFLGRALSGPGVGLGAALLLAVSPVHVIVSNNLRPWALAGLLTAGVLLLLKVVIRPSASRWKLAAAGAVAGLAVATVYPLALLGVPILIALAARWRPTAAEGQRVRWAADIGATIAGGLVAHVIANFVGVIYLGETMSQLFGTDFGVQNLAEISYATNVGWYFAALADPFGLGLAVASVGLLGLLLAARRADPVWLAMLALVAVVVFLQPVAVPLMANRYTVPAVPALIVAAAWLAIAVGSRIGARWPAIERVRPGALLCALLAVPGLLITLEYHRALALPPTRELARDWLETNVPQGASIVQNIRYISPVIADCSVVADSKRDPAQYTCYDVTFMPSDAPNAVLNYLESTDAEYLVFTASTPVGTMQRFGVVDIIPTLRQRYQFLARFHHPGLDHFHDDTATVNPPVEVYRLSPP